MPFATVGGAARGAALGTGGAMAKVVKAASAVGLAAVAVVKPSSNAILSVLKLSVPGFVTLAR